jgi:hypothetical protein
MWNGFLDPDVLDDSFMFDPNSLNDSIVFDGEDGLEAWAEQQLGLENPAFNETSLFDPAITSSGNTETTTLCYGMVGSHSFCPTFQLSQTTSFVP